LRCIMQPISLPSIGVRPFERKELPMTQRAALVTGASSGIGFAIARALLRDGYGMTICARTPERVEAAAKELGELGDVLGVVALIAADDVAEAVRFLTRLSRNCAIPEITMLNTTDRLLSA
jgi:NADP-dependent 3-hydroxy acid dehydrogenase YdfG